MTVAGYAWAGLMFVLGMGAIGFVLNGDVKLWALHVSVVVVGAKVIALAVQYLVLRAALRECLPPASAARTAT